MFPNAKSPIGRVNESPSVYEGGESLGVEEEGDGAKAYEVVREGTGGTKVDGAM